MFYDLVGLKMDPVQLYYSGVELGNHGQHKCLLPTYVNERIALEAYLWQLADELICGSKSWSMLQNDVVPDNFCNDFVPKRQKLLKREN